MDTRGMLLKMAIGESLFFPSGNGLRAIEVTRTAKDTWQVDESLMNLRGAVQYIDS